MWRRFALAALASGPLAAGFLGSCGGRTGLDRDDRGASPDGGSGPTGDAGLVCEDDADGDGYIARACGGTDCDDSDPTAHQDPSQPSPWVFEHVDWAASGAPSCALALDAEDAAHLHYVHPVGELGAEHRYATNRDGTWSIEVLEPTADARPQLADLAVDAAGEPHVAYQHYVEGEVDANGHAPLQEVLRYAHRIDGDWEIESIPDTDSVGIGVALLLDAEGAAHIAYHRHVECKPGGCGHDVRYATNAGGEWAIERVSASGHAAGVSLAFGEDGRMFASYLRAGPDDAVVVVATREDGAWREEVVADSMPRRREESNWEPCCTSLLLDAEGRLHVSFPGGWPGYATNAGGSWESDDIPVDVSFFASFTSLARDATGRVHIVFATDPENRELDPYKAALGYSTGGPHSWTTELVDYWRTNNAVVSMALDRVGGVHIAYLGEDTEVILASRAPSPAACGGGDGR